MFLDQADRKGDGSVPLRLLLAVTLFAAVFLVYAATTDRVGIHIDAEAATVEAWHIASTGSPWLEGDLTPRMKANDFIGEAPNGHVVALRSAGPVLVGIPAYWIFHNDPVPQHFQWGPAGVAAALLAATAVLLMFLSLIPRLSRSLAIATALAFGLATPTWTVSADMLWTHTVTQFGLAGTAFAASRQRWWLSGTFLGVAMLGRVHLALVAAALGLGVGLCMRRVRPVVAIATPAVAALGLLLLWNHWMFGTWSLGGGYGQRPLEAAVGGYDAGEVHAGSDGQLVNLAGFFFAADRGLLVWSPVLIVLVPAVVRSWRFQPPWTRSLLLGGVVYTMVQLRINPFHGGDGFWGYRHGLELLTCALPALGYCLPWLGRVARWLLAPLVALQFAALSVGAIRTTHLVPMERAWESNSFALALRDQPALLATWVAAWVTLGVVVTAWHVRRADSSRLGRDEYRQPVSRD